MKTRKKLWFLVLILACVDPLSANETSVDLGQIVITASRMAQADYKVPSDVTVIGQTQIEASSAQFVSDILKEVAGINIYSSGSIKTSIVDIRGFGDTASRNVLVLVNDRKVNAMDISGPDLLQIPLESVERIEVIRGAGSVLYGDNAVGGVINIITKEGEGNLSGRAGVTYGSYKTFGQDLEVSGEKEGISYYTYAKYFDSEGFRTNNGLLTKDFNGRFGYEVSEQLRVWLSTSWHEDDYRLPGGLSESELDTLGRTGSADQDDFANTKDRFVQVTLDAAPWEDVERWGHFVLDTSFRNRDVYDSFNSFGEFSTKRAIETLGVTGKYIFDRQVFGRDVNFVTGIDFYDSDNDILGSGTNVDDLTISKKEIGGYANLQYELIEDVSVQSGMRYHRVRYDFTQRNVVVNERVTPDEWVFSGGMKYDYAQGANVHFNVQETFRFLATDEWYTTANFPGFGITPGLNLDLEQQSGMQYEVGIKHDFGRRTSASATAYVLDNKNEIFFDPATFSNSNYDKTRRVGLECGLRFDLLQWVETEALSGWEAFVNYTYQHAEFRGGANNDKRIPLVPEYQASAGMSLDLSNRMRLSFAGRYVGSRYAVNDVRNETAAIKPYVICDAKVSYAAEPVEIFLELNNIFDEKYYTYVSKSTVSTAKDYFPAEDRNISLGVSWKF